MGSFTLKVTNVGNIATSSTVTVTDPLPTGLTLFNPPSGASGLTWDCSASTAQNVICTNPVPPNPPVPPFGGMLPPITVTVVIGTHVQSHILNIATVKTPGDLNPANDTAEDPVVVDLPRAVPMVSTWGLFGVVIALLGIGAFTLRRGIRI